MTPMQVTWIRDAHACNPLLTALLALPRIAIDFESDGMYRYKARLCVVQIFDGADVWLIDTLQFDATESLRQLLGPGGPQKVIHDISYDARLLRDGGIALGNVVDTALCARFLGYRQSGLASLLKGKFDLDLSKGGQHANWGTRPVSEELERYLIEDVVHLFALADALLREVDAVGIRPEIGVELDSILTQVEHEGRSETQNAWLRLRGMLDQPPVSQSIARELCRLRDAEAERLDVPIGRVLSNDAIIDICKVKPRTTGDYLKIRGIVTLESRRIAPQVVAAVERGIERGEVPSDELPPKRSVPSPSVRLLWKVRERRLSEWRAQEAKTRAVDLQVVLPGHCLQALAHSDLSLDAFAQVHGLGDGRIARYGQQWLELLSAPVENVVSRD